MNIPAGLFPPAIATLAEKIIRDCTAANLMITTVESCTGGLISAALTEIAGSSAVVDRGLIVYSYPAKTALVGVNENTLQNDGAVSASVAETMAAGGLERSNADISIAVTGIAGPGGATPSKPVGLVYMAIASRRGVRSWKSQFDGNRTQVRLATVIKALEEIAAEAALIGETQAIV